MKTHRLTKIAGAMVVAFGLASNAMASDTSSAMRGKILDPQGNAAANVKITVVHQPTGTVTELTTNESGAFTAKGLRVGGPYTVVVDSDTYNDAMLENIFLTLGDTYRLETQLQAAEMEKIQVVGTSILRKSGGASSNFGADTIDNLPSFNNDIKDIARLNPLITINGSGEMTVAGSNPRTNSITVDGISQNDDFGLSYGGYATQQPPVTLDSIEQVAVETSPFNGRASDFSGAAINAVTKSGSNDFKFKGFAEYSSPSMAGKVDQIETIVDEDGDNVLDENRHRTFEIKTVDPIQTESRYGFTVGGPIIKDELFFFVNYRHWESKLDLDYGFIGSDATHRYNVSEADYNTVLSTMQSVYGLEDGLGGDPKDTNDYLLTKITWNINQDHRLDFTYQWQDDNDERNFGTGGDTVEFASGRYTYESSYNNFAAKVFSDWNDDFSTEVFVAYKDVKSDRATNSNIGSVMVEKFFRGPAFQFGTEVFSHANSSATETLTLGFEGSYLIGEHDLKFGAEFKSLNLYNLFGETSRGAWEFDNFDDFAAGEVGNFRGSYDFEYKNAFTNDVNDLAYDATRETLALYVEDSFYATDDLEITAALRYERMSSSDQPTLNENFLATYGFTNQENLDGLDILMPRVGFKFYAMEDVEVYGGIGRYYGGVPNVWYNNPYQNDGITFVAAPNSAVADYYSNNTVSDFETIPQAIKDSLVQGAGSTNYTDPNFELPSKWRTQLGVSYDFDSELLGDGYNVTAEINFERGQNEAVWRNTALVNPTLLADGERVAYESRYEGDLDENFDIMMTNSDLTTNSRTMVLALAKQFDNGVRVNMSYTNQDIEDLHAGSSSRAQSNYKHNAIKNRNQDTIGAGHYQIEHAFKLNLSYQTEFFAGYESRFDMFFERRSGRPYSYTMGMYRDRWLGDTEDFYSNNAYLAYIPTGADDPNMDWDSSRISWDELEVLLNKAGITERGVILDRNTARQPWVTSMNVSFKQEFPGFADGHKGQFYIMVDNFLNLLNDDWGIEKRMRFSTQTLYDLRRVDDEGRYVIENRFDGADVRNYNQIDISASSWQAKIGINYKF